MIFLDSSQITRAIDGELRNIKKLGSNLKSFRAPLEIAVRTVMIPSIYTNFQVGGRPKWIPTSPQTIAFYERNKIYHERTLVNSGKLRRAATQLNIWKYNREEAFIKGLPERAWYGMLHQFGYRTNFHGKTVTVPARPFLTIQPEDNEKINRIFGMWLDERVKKLG